MVKQQGPRPGQVWAEGESMLTGSSLAQARKEAYIEWLLTPVSEREPRTKKEFAELLEVTTRTLQTYSRDPFVQREVISRGRALARVERAADVLDALYSRATDPEGGAPAVSAARVWLDWVDKRVDGDRDKDLSDLSDEELFALVNKLKEGLDQR